MAKFSERRHYVLCVIQPSTRSTLGEYDSRPPLARYVWYFISYLRSSCCSETHVRPRFLPVFLPLSTLDVTHVRRCTRPSPLYRTKQRRKAGRGTGNEANHTPHIAIPCPSQGHLSTLGGGGGGGGGGGCFVGSEYSSTVVLVSKV